jgi:hypothetical protein
MRTGTELLGLQLLVRRRRYCCKRLFIPATGSNPNLDVALGGIIAAGVLYGVIALIVMQSGAGWVERLMPPVVTGAVVAAIGLNLAPVAIKSVSGGQFDAGIALLTVLIIGLTMAADPCNKVIMGSNYRGRLERNRKFVDSPLEGAGFEPSVPLYGELGTSGACDATHAAIVKPETSDRSRRRVRRAICGTPGAPSARLPRDSGGAGCKIWAAVGRTGFCLFLDVTRPLVGVAFPRAVAESA